MRDSIQSPGAARNGLITAPIYAVRGTSFTRCMSAVKDSRVTLVTDLLEEVAHALGYSDGQSSLLFEFQNGHLMKFRGQHTAGRKWLEGQWNPEESDSE